MEEIFRLVRERVEKMGYWRLIKGGVVLTGGGALMPGAAELAYEVFGLPVRTGAPTSLGGLVEEYRNPVVLDGGGPRAARSGASGTMLRSRRPRSRGRCQGSARADRKARRRRGQRQIRRSHGWERG